MPNRLKLAGLSTALFISACVAPPPTESTSSGGPLIIHEVQHDVSPLPLSQTPAAPTLPQPNEDEVTHIPRPQRPAVADPVVQSALPTVNVPSPSRSFEGIGQDFTGPQGTFSVTGAPPDTNGAV